MLYTYFTTIHPVNNQWIVTRCLDGETQLLQSWEVAVAPRQTWYFSETDVWESRTVLRWTKNTCIREHRVGVKWWPNPRQAATLSRNPCSRRGVTADHRVGGDLPRPSVNFLTHQLDRRVGHTLAFFKWRNPSLQLVVIKGDPLFWNFHSLAGEIKIAFLILPPPFPTEHRTTVSVDSFADILYRTK